jgi:hypothetical protein
MLRIILLCMLTSQIIENTRSVAQLTNNPEEFSHRMVTVQGFIFHEYHGMSICDDNYERCIPLLNPDKAEPKPTFTLERDEEYQKYELWSLRLRSGENAKIGVTLRGKFDSIYELKNGKKITGNKQLSSDLWKYQFILQKVLNVKEFPAKHK